ncbi:IS701 family transposase, partial [Methylobacterium mesophilicum]
HFEGRSWTGLHRHALMTMMAYAFLQARRLAAAGRKKKNRLPAAPALDAGDPPSHPGSPQSATTAAMPAL